MRLRRVRPAIVGMSLLVCIALAAPERAMTAATKVQVRSIDVGHVRGQPGVKVRLTLHTGEAVEYRTEDAADTTAVLRMAEIFLAGNARMFAEVDGAAVRAIQVSGPVRFGDHVASFSHRASQSWTSR
jgi:hypothetical protein